MNYSLTELQAFARHTAGNDSSDAARAEHHTISALLALALQALNRFEAENHATDRMPTRSGRFTTAVGLTDLAEELRLVEEETGIAPDPNAPIVGYMRAVAGTGNARAQRLLARLKAVLVPPL